jgi:glyoxylase-like metal-dependent hydrolase (beta-lactamase superfamily II)
MIEEILANIYKLEIPIPDSPLKATNCYMIRGPRRNLLIDTGFRLKECLEAMSAALTELRVDMTQTDIFVTHFHSDHIGLVPHLVTDSTKIYFNQTENDWLKHNTALNDSLEFARSSGWPDDEIDSIRSFHDARESNYQRDLNFSIIKGKGQINVGSYMFECIETPGHSKGHLCLYERGRKLLFSGDHLLKKITPGLNIMWPYEWNPLAEYLESLDKVGALDVDLVLPGHSDLFENCRERVAELKSHHARRLDEVISVLGRGNKTAYQIGSALTWDVSYTSWEAFPVLQKILAVNEAAAHLKYLENKKKVRRRRLKGRLVYSPS